MRHFEAKSQKDKVIARRLKKLFAFDQLPPGEKSAAHITKSDGTLLKLPVWAARQTPCYITHTELIVAGQWYWVEAQSESAMREVAYVVGIIPPKHAMEDDPIDVEAASGTQVVLLRATSDNRLSKTPHYYCSELMKVVSSDRVQEPMEGDVLGKGRKLVPELGSLNTRLMLTHHGEPEVSDFHGLASCL